ncbi:hypothetical protein [uncultured Hoeflea sp.]|uniref:hypothetical protein n=1 Tax=uncultured Hoeflea sp. TaxID=538666 RepID=UPI0030EBF25E|tara:strand:+ start:266 stop:544 length:279 start_codon:yes stop_codon:yes gene_type:complete
MKIKGLEAIKKKTDQMARFADEIDGEIANVTFDPENPSSIEAALQEINYAIEEKANSYERNDWIQSLAEQLKEISRKNLLEKAAAYRIGRND